MVETGNLLRSYFPTKFRMAILHLLLLIVCTKCQTVTKHDIKLNNPISNRENNQRYFEYLDRPMTTFGDCVCGQINSPEQREERIINGKEVSPPYKYPWVAAIKKNGEVICTGSLINNKFVLTDTECLIDNNTALYEIVLGAHKIESVLGSNLTNVMGEQFVQRRTVSRIKYFKQYFYNSIDSEPGFQIQDVALAKLNTPVSFTKQVSPVCLPPNEWIPSSPVRDGIIVGWGKTELGSVSNVLIEAVVQVIGGPQCLQQSSHSSIPDNTFCAAGPGKDYCQGDAGGPLVIKSATSYTQIGVASWKYFCALNKFPGLFTSVGSFTNKIYYRTKQAIYCRNPDAGL